MAIVVYAHRPKRPPPKQKPSALARAAKAAAATKALLAIVTATSEKQLKRLRMERAQQGSGETPPSADAIRSGRLPLRRNNCSASKEPTEPTP
jgi:hypothetical protein